jgi:palmitoyltransferase
MGGRNDCFRTRIGTSFDAERWLSLDPCGLVGLGTSLFVHAFAFGVTACFLIEGSLLATTIFLLVYTPITLLALASLYMAWTTDPGVVPMGARPLVTVKRAASGEIEQTNGRRNRALRRCPKCNDNFKPPRAHHDSVTGRCIVKFDHFWYVSFGTFCSKL